jgi:hypothetical protein
MVASIPEFSLLLISLFMQFLSVSVVPKYLKFDTPSKDIFAIFKLCSFPAFLQRDINIHLVFSGFTSRPTSLLVSNKASVVFCTASTISHYINVISIGQKLMCPIQFQSFLVLLDPPEAYSKAKLKNNGDKASPCFRPFWKGNLSDRFLPIWTLL